MNRFKVIAREGHHAVIDVQFEDEETARAICAVLGRVTGVVLAGQTVVLTPPALEGALRTNGGTLYQLSRLTGGISRVEHPADEPADTVTPAEHSVDGS